MVMDVVRQAMQLVWVTWRATHSFVNLFMSTGKVIYADNNEQDMCQLGTYAMILIALLLLMGVPFLAGFYSK